MTQAETQAGAAPLLTQDRRPTLGRDEQSADMIVDQMTMTEEQLLRAMESLTPSEPSSNGSGGGGGNGGRGR